MDHLRIYNTLDSTNKEAQRLLATGPVLNGTCLLTKEQTEGKGQYGRSWHADAGSHLAMSIILTPQNLSASELPLISMKTSLGIVRGLRQLDPNLNPLIKWPNDIYLQGKKLCGILIENALAGNKVQHIIIGIGMNVNERIFPSDLPNPVSLFTVTGELHDLYQMAQLIRMHVLETVDISDLYWKQEYDSSLFGLHNDHEFDYQGGKIKGTVLGVDEQGRILLGFEGGLTRSFFTHELKWLIG
jgi:BirA family transcriptional regulator, biotin operon repressor / biotin---[acetyl-CoA-carboxylase] ligase